MTPQPIRTHSPPWSSVSYSATSSSSVGWRLTKTLLDTVLTKSLLDTVLTKIFNCIIMEMRMGESPHPPWDALQKRLARALFALLLSTQCVVRQQSYFLFHNFLILFGFFLFPNFPNFPPPPPNTDHLGIVVVLEFKELNKRKRGEKNPDLYTSSTSTMDVG